MKSEIWFTHHTFKGLTISHTSGPLIRRTWVFTVTFSSVWLHIVFQFPNQQYKPLSLEQLPAPDRKKKIPSLLWQQEERNCRRKDNPLSLPERRPPEVDSTAHAGVSNPPLQEARWVLYSEEGHICLIIVPVAKRATAHWYSLCSLVFPRSLAVRVGPRDYFWPPGYAWQLLHHFWVKVDNCCGPSLFPPAVVTLGVMSSVEEEVSPQLHCTAGERERNLDCGVTEISKFCPEWQLWAPEVICLSTDILWLLNI